MRNGTVVFVVTVSCTWLTEEEEAERVDGGAVVVVVDGGAAAGGGGGRGRGCGWVWD